MRVNWTQDLIQDLCSVYPLLEEMGTQLIFKRALFRHEALNNRESMAFLLRLRDTWCWSMDDT